MIWKWEEGKKSYFVLKFLTQGSERGHMGGGPWGRKETGDPSGDAEKILDSMQETQVQGSSQGWSEPMEGPGTMGMRAWREGETQDRPEEHQQLGLGKTKSSQQRLRRREERPGAQATGQSHKETVPSPFPAPRPLLPSSSLSTLLQQ